MTSVPLERFGYSYIPGPFQYSGGIAALPGFAIERIRFAEPVPLEDGFARIERYLTEARLPLTAFAACELRSPAPFDDEGFRAFNRVYVGTLQRWGVMTGDTNPVARSNTCPEIGAPSVPSFHAFSLVVRSTATIPNFVIAGSAEAQEGSHPYKEKTIRFGETSDDALREKATFVLRQMETRMAALGRSWAETTGTQVYTIRDIHPFLADAIVGRGAARHGITWHYNRPPVKDLEYEMDCRGVQCERVIA